MSLVEIDDSPCSDRKEYILDFIEANAAAFVGKSRFTEIETLTSKIMQTGIKKKDATHLACSMIAECDYFITTDNRILKYNSGRVKPVNPIIFIKIWRE